MECFNTKQFNNLSFQKKFFLQFVSQQEKGVQIMLCRAFRIAEHAHQGQVRDEGVCYLIHPLRTANIILSELGLNDPELISAALLHDVVEDSAVSLENIKNLFTEKTAQLVKNLTRERPNNETEEQKKINKVKKFEELMQADFHTRLTKCADILDNVRSWPLIPKDNPSRKKFPRWLNEIKQYCLPLAEKTSPVLASEMIEAFTIALKEV